MTRIDDEKQRQAIVLYGQLLSPSKVGVELGISDESVRLILIRNNVPRQSINGVYMKYSKTDFGGDPTEQARIIGFAEDFWVGKDANQIRAATTTTHPAQINVFDDFFGGNGHVSRTPGYNKGQSCYQWLLQVMLNRTFDFLLEYKKNPLRFLRTHVTEDGEIYAYIGALTDAEGCIRIFDDHGYPRAYLSIGNNNRQILEWTRQTIGGRIHRNGHGYSLELYGDQAVKALRRVPIAHAEKAASKELIFFYADNGGLTVESIKAYKDLRRRIDEEVQLCTMQARLEWIRRHGKPHRYDPDQTIPENLTLSPSFFLCFQTTLYFTV